MTDYFERLIQEYIKDLGLKDKLRLIQKLLKEIERDISVQDYLEKAPSP